MDVAAYRAILKRLGVEPPQPCLNRALVARLLGMPLDHFEQEGYPLEVRVPWLAVTLWFVPSGADAEALGREGVTRGRIWTAGELMDLLTLTRLSRNAVKTVALANLELAGEVVGVRSRR